MSRLRGRAAILAASMAISVVAVVGLGPATSIAVAPKLTGTWSPVAAPAVGGQPFSLAFDPVHHQLLADVQLPLGLVGGGDHTAVLEGNTWRVTAAPPRAFPFALVFDPALGKVVALDAVGGCASTWSGTAWSSSACPPVPEFVSLRAAAYDGTTGAVIVVLDTFALPPPDCCHTPSYVDTETWTWDGVTWRKLTPAKEPAPLIAPEPVPGCFDIGCPDFLNSPLTLLGGATWDVARHKVVLVGDLWRTWTWNGSNWSGGVAPAPSTGPTSVTYDSAVATDISYGYPSLTAAWDDAVWQPIVTKGLPPTWGPTAYDPDLGGLVLLGQAQGGGLLASSLGTGPATLWRFTPGV